MHEMSLSEGVLQVLEDSARAKGFDRIKAVWLEIGNLAAVDKDAMRFAFDVVCKGTLAADARLEIIDVPGAAWCFGCNASVDVNQRYDACPECGGFQLQVTGGDELKIRELEVE